MTPKLVVVRGLGHRGKSTLTRVLVHRAVEAGRDVVIADADRSMPASPTLQRFMDGVNHPGDVPESGMYDWYRELIDQQAEAKTTVLIDTAGGDHSWPEFMAEADLEETLLGLPVPIHLNQIVVLGPDVAEVNIFKDRHGVRPGSNVIAVLNEGIGPPGQRGAAMFSAVLKHKTYVEAMHAGMREVFLPRLRCLDRINADNLSFNVALTKLGFTDRSALQVWLRRVDERLQPVAELLP